MTQPSHTGHPDFLITAARPFLQQIANELILIPAQDVVTRFYAIGQTGDFCVVQLSGGDALQVDMFAQVDQFSFGPEVVVCGHGGLGPVWGLVQTPQSELQLTIHTLDAVPRSMTLIVASYLNETLEHLFSKVDTRVNATTLTDGHPTAAIISSPLAGMYHRIAGVVSCDHDYSAVMRWGVGGADAPGVLTTWDEQLGVAAGGTPIFFDVPVRAPGATVYATKTAAGVGVVDATLHSYSP
jgi:hypothetical protein